MPRPKRTKVAPSKPISFATIAAEKSNPSKPELALSPASGSITSSRRTNTSDDSDGIVTTNKAGVNRRGVAPQIATMSGALAVQDVGEKRPRPLSSKRRVALSRIAREADHAKAIDALRAQRDTALAAEKAEKEGKQAEVQAQPPHTTKTRSAYSGLSTHPPANTVQDSKSTQATNARSTPPRETSILAIENFKRRPRQPSLLQIARAQNENAAEGSSVDDTLNDFDPDDESTPLRLSNTGLQHDPSSSSSRKRKRFTPQIQVPASQPQDLRSQSSSPAPSLSDGLPDTPAEETQPNPPLPAVPAAKPTAAQKAADSDTLAPPRSPSPSSPQKKPLHTQFHTKKSQIAPKANTKSTKSKHRKQPSTTLPQGSSHTRPSPTKAPMTRSPLKPVTTSALQNLLPRRHRVMSQNKENNVYDLNTSSDIDSFDNGGMDEDADELSYHATAKLPRKAGTGKAKGAGKKGKATANGAGSRPKAQHGGKGPSRTYTGKQNAEPDVDDDDGVGSGGEGDGEGVGMMDGKAREEMKKLAAKFREVDDWGLEFEEVTGSSDRMRDAR
ncbi:MAG: hypothetical protein LQ338_000303 [Usnochroma carphineum]|nr:MAG: hypothetical protein LQ338_000303 [Usnochroma carphineum]